MQAEINQTLDDLKVIVYRSEHIRNNFFNDLKPKSELQEKVKNHVNEYLQTLVADALNCYDLLFEICTCETDSDLEILIDAIEEPEPGVIN